MKKYKYSRKQWFQKHGMRIVGLDVAKTQSEAYKDLLSTLPQEEKRENKIMVSDCCHSTFSEGEDENSDGWTQCDKCGERCEAIFIPSPSLPEFEEIKEIKIKLAKLELANGEQYEYIPAEYQFAETINQLIRNDKKTREALNKLIIK